MSLFLRYCFLFAIALTFPNVIVILLCFITAGVMITVHDDNKMLENSQKISLEGEKISDMLHNMTYEECQKTMSYSRAQLLEMASARLQ